MRFLASLGLAILVMAAHASPTMARGGGGRGGGGGLIAVRGYVTSRGSYVAPHLRTRPDGILENNLSYRGRSPDTAVLANPGSAPGALVASEGPQSIPGPTTWTDTGPTPREAKEPWCATKRVIGTGSGFCMIN